MESKRLPEEAVFRLLEQSKLQGQEAEARLEDALRPDYWRNLNPLLALEDERHEKNAIEDALDDERERGLVAKFRKQGYFELEPQLPPHFVERMREGVERLRSEGWPPVFAYVYDEFWQVWRAPALERLLTSVLGQNYQQTSHVWLHYVHTHEGSGGWPPHIDGQSNSNRVSVWIPLSDATLANGCMHLIPRHLVPARVAENFLELESVSMEELKVLLQSMRAMPARAGSVLCWDYGMIHWGARVSAPLQPRISLAASFIGAGAEPTAKEPPLLDGHAGWPTFTERLRLIGKAILTYEKREPLMRRYTTLAERLKSLAASAGIQS